jgi:DNA (cytosine-5)-methyltransferase 1
VSPVYPDMKLYQEIIFLSKHCKDSKWNIENVIPYYNPLIPGQKIGRHMFWNNFTIKQSELKLTNNYAVQSGAQGPLQELFGFNLDGIKFNQRKDKMLRSCVLPELGKHIFDCAMGYKIKTKQQEMF